MTFSVSHYKHKLGNQTRKYYSPFAIAHAFNQCSYFTGERYAVVWKRRPVSTKTMETTTTTTTRKTTTTECI